MADVAKALAESGTQGATQFGPFGRLALDPRKLSDVAAALFGVAKAPLDAAQNIQENYRPGAENEIVNQDIGRQAFDAGSVAMGGAPFVERNALGSFGGKVDNPIKAYHGSPHDFDKFDAAHIGKGEGAQAYGHGLYFAESEPVARTYRQNLSPDGFMVNGKPPEGIVRSALDTVDGNIIAQQGLEAALEAAAKDHARWGGVDDKYAQALRGLDPNTVTQPGKMYEVALHATPEQFLDWDKPLSQQSEGVRAAVEKAKAAGAFPASPNRYIARDDAQARALAEAGIPGIRYKDELSRAAASPEQMRAAKDKLAEAEKWARSSPGSEEFSSHLAQMRKELQDLQSGANATSNYVVFPGNEHIIEILKKYGIAGLLAAGAAMPDQGENH